MISAHTSCTHSLILAIVVIVFRVDTLFSMKQFASHTVLPWALVAHGAPRVNARGASAHRIAAIGCLIAGQTI